MYAQDDIHRETLIKKYFNGRGRVEVSRFKGLGEMPAHQLKETTMDPEKRKLVRITVPNGNSSDYENEAQTTATLVEDLMGRKPERRLAFIQKNAQTIKQLDV